MSKSDDTKERIARTFLECMETTPYGKINVSQLCERAHISRKTFYYHFEDIYDLASWALSHRLLECLGESGDCFLWGDGVLTLFQRCKEHREVCRCAVDSIHVWQMAKSYCDRCMNG